MAASAFHQSAFLGGEFSPLSQGRSDLPAYHQALSVCLNGLPVEEGAWVRRSGVEHLAPTRNRTAAKLLPYFSSDTPFNFVMEFTDLAVRFYGGTALACTTNINGVLTSSLAAGVLTLGMGGVGGLVVGDDIMLWSSPTADPAKIGPFRGRVMRITAISSLTLTVKDDTGSAFVGLSSAANDLANTIVYQVAKLATSWSTPAVLEALRVVQVGQVLTGSYALVLSHTVVPTGIHVASDLTVTIAAAVNADTNVGISDGPYLDPQGEIIGVAAETGTVSGYSGSITFTPASTVFVGADVGRCIRFFQQPPAYNAATGYVYGDVVTYGDGWWTSIVKAPYSPATGVIPGTIFTTGAGVQVTVWAPSPDQGVWAWGVITAQAGTSATVTLYTPLKSVNGSTISAWRLGLYMAGQYPTCGLYRDGRLWLGGAVPNRFDASIAGGNPLTFSPTEPNGMVTDANAISETISADDNNTILWMASDQQGIIMGTISGEWLVHADGDIITPTSIQADRASTYGCADMAPVRCGMALVFVQRYARRLMEYLADGYSSGRFTARHLNEHAKHMAESGIAEIVYQQETAPIVWARMSDGSIAGCTYRRASRFITEAPVVEGWHRQVIGGSYAGAIVRPIGSMCVLPGPDALSDLLYVATSDVDGGDNFVGVLRPLFEDG